MSSRGSAVAKRPKRQLRKRSSGEQNTISGLRFVIWGGFMVVQETGTLEIANDKRSACFILKDGQRLIVDMPSKEIQAWHAKLFAPGFKVSTAVLVHVKGGVNGAALCRYGDIDVYPYEAIEGHAWFLAIDSGTEDGIADDVSVYDHEDHRLEISRLRKRKLLIQVFEQFSNHMELSEDDEMIDEDTGAYSEIVTGGPYFYYPIVPCPPDEEPPRTEIVLNQKCMGPDFEAAMRCSRKVFYFVSSMGKEATMSLPRDSDPLLRIFLAGDIAVLFVGKGYRKHTVPIMSNGKLRTFSIQGRPSMM